MAADLSLPLGCDSAKRPNEQVLAYREPGTCSLLTDSYLSVYSAPNHEIQAERDSPSRP